MSGFDWRNSRWVSDNISKGTHNIIEDTGGTIGNLQVLVDISGPFNIAVGGIGGAFVLEPIATTFPAGNLHDGQYDIVIDECENGVFNPGVDLIIGQGAGFAFKVVGASEYDVLELSQMKLDATQKADVDAGLELNLQARHLDVKVYGNTAVVTCYIVGLSKAPNGEIERSRKMLLLR